MVGPQMYRNAARRTAEQSADELSADGVGSKDIALETYASLRAVDVAQHVIEEDVALVVESRQGGHGFSVARRAIWPRSLNLRRPDAVVAVRVAEALSYCAPAPLRMLPNAQDSRS